MKIYEIKKIDKDKDVQDIFLLEKEIFKESAYSLETLKEMASSKEYRITLEGDKQIRGYLIIHSCFDFYEIMKIGVKEEFRNQKIAENLINECLENIDKDILLEVRKSNIVAQNFYSKMGFVSIGERKNYYSDSEDAILMRFENK